MEVEHHSETVDRKETVTSPPMTVDKDCKWAFDEVDTYIANKKKSNCDIIKHKNLHSTSKNFGSSLNNFELSKTIRCPETLQNCDETKELPDKTEDCVRFSHDLCGSTIKKIFESDYSRVLFSNPDILTENFDETNHSDSPGSPTANESPNDDSSEMPADAEDSSSFDARRTRRRRKKDGDLCCPICGITVRMPDLEHHFTQEVEKLTRIPGNLRKPRQEFADGINTTYVQIKSNRENRLTAKVAKYAAKSQKEIQCPVCYLRISGSEEDVNKHVALCFQNEDNSDEHIIVDDDEEDDDASFEEYEFADQTRIRPISLIPGGYRSLEGQLATRRRSDEDDELEIDIDDTKVYGDPHELDVISNETYGDNDVREQLRKAVLVDPTAQPQVLESRKWSDITGADENSREGSSDDPEKSTEVEKGNLLNENRTSDHQMIAVSDHVISSLKEQIKDLEDQNKAVKCLICMEPYTKPVVSTTCWHVYCEECWLMTMGVKKLCPQCNMIVFPADLRKIYL